MTNNSMWKRDVQGELELKASEEKDFRNDSEVSVVRAVFTCRGKVIHSLGAAAENARSPRLYEFGCGNV